MNNAHLLIEFSQKGGFLNAANLCSLECVKERTAL